MYGTNRNEIKEEMPDKIETKDGTGESLTDSPTEFGFQKNGRNGNVLPPLPLARSTETSATPPPYTPGNKTLLPENGKFQAAQLIDCARFFGCLQTEEWIKPRATKVICEDDPPRNIDNYPLAALNERYRNDDNRITYYHRGNVQMFLDLFLNIRLSPNSNGELICPQTSPEIWYTFREQNLQTNDRHVVILLNKLKVVIHRILARRVTTLPGLFQKYDQNISNGSATLLLIIISSFNLPTNSLIKAATFLPRFFSKYTVLSNDTIIRTLLSLSNIEYNQDAIGNPTLQMLETYRKNLYAFQYTSSITPTITPTFLRSIRSYAEMVLNELNGIPQGTPQHRQSSLAHYKSHQKRHKKHNKGHKKHGKGHKVSSNGSITKMIPSKKLMIL